MTTPSIGCLVVASSSPSVGIGDAALLGLQLAALGAGLGLASRRPRPVELGPPRPARRSGGGLEVRPSTREPRRRHQRSNAAS